MRTRRTDPKLLRRFARDESGAFLPEFAVTIVIFLFVLFGLIDFGRMAYGFVLAEKAVQTAARIAAVRPPVCASVPTTNVRGTNTLPPYGTKCSAAANTCASAGTQTCVGSSGSATSAEIWQRVGALMPPGSTQARLRYRYVYDQNLGFLGGPYVPMVTVELDQANPLQFQFVTPLGGLAQLLGAAAGGFGTFNFPVISASMPGEDLDVWTNG